MSASGMGKFSGLSSCTIWVPATSANLGVGYDCLGMALDLVASFRFEPACELLIDGCPGKFRGSDNLVWTSYLEACGKLGIASDPVHITIDSPIPLSGGLGSSSACVVAGVTAAQIVHQRELDLDLTLEIAVEIEGHPDNVAPAIYGGVVSSFVDEKGEVTCVRHNVSEAFRFVTVSPTCEVRTEDARRVMPHEVPIATAIWQMGRCVAVVQALSTGDYKLLGQACHDKLHEPYRKPLIPCYDAVYSAAIAAGAEAFFISGSGSTMIAVCDGEGQAEAVADACHAIDDDSWVNVLMPSAAGVRVTY